MGNRATVIFVSEDEKSISPAVYLHWNGGPESIYAFLNEMNIRKIRKDQDYECARFIHIVGDYFDMDTIGSSSLGVSNGPKEITPKSLGKVKTDHGDNGFYIICRKKDGSVKMRRFKEVYLDNGIDVQELSADEVEREKEEAMKHKYIPEFAESFKEINGTKKIE